jgi:hypothetical protein
MSFRQQESRRKKKAAQLAAQNQSRWSGTSAGKWWLTLVRVNTCCAKCGRSLRVGMEMVYRASPREALCMECAESHPSARSWRPSLSWEKKHPKYARRRRA